MVSRKERKLRKAIARRKLDNAILQLSDLDEFLNFNKCLRNRAIVVRLNLLLFHKKLSEEQE